MAASRLQEFKNRLAKWEEEYAANPQKTEITPSLIKRFKMLIQIVERNEQSLRESEQLVDEFLEQ